MMMQLAVLVGATAAPGLWNFMTGGSTRRHDDSAGKVPEAAEAGDLKDPCTKTAYYGGASYCNGVLKFDPSQPEWGKCMPSHSGAWAGGAESGPTNIGAALPGVCADCNAEPPPAGAAPCRACKLRDPYEAVPRLDCTACSDATDEVQVLLAEKVSGGTGTEGRVRCYKRPLGPRPGRHGLPALCEEMPSSEKDEQHVIGPLSLGELWGVWDEAAGAYVDRPVRLRPYPRTVEWDEQLDKGSERQQAMAASAKLIPLFISLYPTGGLRAEMAAQLAGTGFGTEMYHFEVSTETALLAPRKSAEEARSELADLADRGFGVDADGWDHGEYASMHGVNGASFVRGGGVHGEDAPLWPSKVLQSDALFTLKSVQDKLPHAGRDMPGRTVLRGDRSPYAAEVELATRVWDVHEDRQRRGPGPRFMLSQAALRDLGACFDHFQAGEKEGPKELATAAIDLAKKAAKTPFQMFGATGETVVEVARRPFGHHALQDAEKVLTPVLEREREREREIRETVRKMHEREMRETPVQLSRRGAAARFSDPVQLSRTETLVELGGVSSSVQGDLGTGQRDF